MRRIILSWVAALLFAAVGLLADFKTGFEHELFRRSGALITCFSVLIPLIQMNYARLSRPGSEATDALLAESGMLTPAQRAEKRFATANTASKVALAILGTLVAAFGDFARYAAPLNKPCAAGTEIACSGSATSEPSALQRKPQSAQPPQRPQPPAAVTPRAPPPK